MNSILDRLNSSDDIKKLNKDELEELSKELRSFLIASVSKTGGHLASNLGAVELTLALHRVFSPEKDRIVYDVGHQSYVHKLLTGRKDRFGSLRSFGGLSGFPKPSESDCDAFIAGHASNSISVALGMARARTILGEDYNVIALIGDGALSGGLAYEGLNNAGQSGEKLIVVLNDNGMSITRNVGGMAKFLSHQRTKPRYAGFKKNYRRIIKRLPFGDKLHTFNHNIKTAVKNAIFNCVVFEEMGFQYFGPIDGHDIEELEYMLNYAKRIKGPVLLHVVTKKGKGYAPAENNPGLYHGVSPFDPAVGIKSAEKKDFSAVFGAKLLELAEKDSRICAITAAMRSGTGLEAFAREMPERFFDEGIAEGHAVSMAAGMAKQGAVPVFAVYSTFLQRSYDMLIHDTAILGLHVVFGVDRAGIVGADGETHQGTFDVCYLRQIPGMKIYSPASFAELRDMLEKAVGSEGPVAVRYPRSGEGEYKKGGCAPSSIEAEGSEVTLIAYGTMINNALSAAKLLENKGISARVLKLGIIKPLDMQAVIKCAEETGRIAVIEDCVFSGSVGENIAAELSERNSKAECCLINLGDSFVPHGSPKELMSYLGLDGEGICRTVIKSFFADRSEAE